jgi:hypothetical protein
MQPDLILTEEGKIAGTDRFRFYLFQKKSCRHNNNHQQQQLQQQQQQRTFQITATVTQRSIDRSIQHGVGIRHTTTTRQGLLDGVANHSFQQFLALW